MKILNKVTQAITTTASKAKFQVSKHSPEILMVTGIVGLVGAAVWACKATLEAKDTIETYKDTKEDIESTIRYVDEERHDIIEYTEEDKKRDLAKVKMKTTLDLVKEYAPAVSIAAVSITAIIVSNNIMHKRALALATAYTALDTSFKKYRDNVIERYGEEVDNEMRHGVHKKTIEQTTVDGKGKEKTEKIEVTEFESNGEYTRIFDSSNRYWDGNDDYVRMFLDSEESRANNLLRMNGHVFLNEIFERLGFEKTKIGQVVGWEYTPDKDCYIDFDIYQVENEHKVILNFNPQGYILDKLEKGE